LLLKEMHLTISAERNQNPSKILLKDTKWFWQRQAYLPWSLITRNDNFPFKKNHHATHSACYKNICSNQREP
jgi:hypothetical protein